MITFTHETTRYTVKPEKAEAYRKLAAKPPAIKRKIDRSHDAMRRDYPKFFEGMKTGDYLSQYAALNSRLLIEGEGFTFADRVAPMLDPSMPEVLEELDADYVPPVWTLSPKKATVVDLRRSIQSALDLLHAGDVDMAQCVLSEAMK